MPEVHTQGTVKAPLQIVWDYIKDMGNWAQAIPGYQSHRQDGETDSIWAIKTDLGPFTRVLETKVHVTEWVECKRVAFSLQGVNEPWKGNGSFEATEDGATTGLGFNLQVNATGITAPAVNVLAGPVLQIMGKNFAAELTARIEKVATSPG